MAVDQAKNRNLFTLSVDHVNQFYSKNHHHNNITNNNVILPPTMMNATNETPHINGMTPYIHGRKPAKMPPSVKADSGITFNNSALVPQSQQPSRKRPREVNSCGAPMLPAMNPLISCTVPSTTTSVTSKDSTGFTFLGEDLYLQIMQYQLDFDRLISQQMEKIRMDMEERTMYQIRILAGAVQESITRRLRDKEEELARVEKISWALAEKVRTLSLENQIWRELAQTNEAAANALRTNLEQVLQQTKDNVAAEDTDDAASSCGSNGNGVDDEGEDEDSKKWRLVTGYGENEWIYRGNSGGNRSRMLCRRCGEGESSVLLLPCRHLCLCTTCGPAVNSCPVCDTVKNASVHVNLS